MESGTAPYDNLALVQSTVTALGVRHIRENFNPSAISNGGYANMASIASGGVTHFDMIADPRQLTVAQVPTHISDVGASTIENIEGPNEYDISGDPNWQTTVAAYQASLYSQIAKEWPVFSFSLVGVDTSAFETVGNQSANMDFGSMHSYANNSPPLTNFTTTLALWPLVSSTKPIVVTETGYTTTLPGGISTTAQGKYIPRLLFDSFNLGIPRTYIYELFDEVNVGDTGYGLVTSTGTPKQAFTTVANLVTLLSDQGVSFSPGNLSFGITNNTSPISTTLLQKRNGTFYLILWQEATSWNTSTNTDIAVPVQNVLVGANATVASWSLYDPSIGTTPQSSGTGGAIPVAVPDYPIVLEIVP